MCYDKDKMAFRGGVVAKLDISIRFYLASAFYLYCALYVIIYTFLGC